MSINDVLIKYKENKNELENTKYYLLNDYDNEDMENMYDLIINMIISYSGNNKRKKIELKKG